MPGSPHRGAALAFSLHVRRLPVLMSLLVGAVTWCGIGLRSHAQSTVRLFDLTTAHGIDGERPFQPARVFASDDDAVYLWYAAEGCEIGTTITSTWRYLETDPPFRLAEGSVTVTG